jgi:hypothetical protein
MRHIGQSKPGLGLSRFVAPRCATEATWAQRRKSAYGGIFSFPKRSWKYHSRQVCDPSENYPKLWRHSGARYSATQTVPKMVIYGIVTRSRPGVLRLQIENACAGGNVAIVRLLFTRKTDSPVQFELTERTGVVGEARPRDAAGGAMWIFNSFKQCWRYLRSLFWRKPMDRGVFADIEETHGHEEKLRQESMALVAADPELSRRLEMVQKAMALIFGYTIEYTSRSEDEATMQLLGIRLFNAAASGIKLALSGYYQTAFHQARDIMETGYLLDYFRTSPEQRPAPCS